MQTAEPKYQPGELFQLVWNQEKLSIVPAGSRTGEIVVTLTLEQLRSYS